MPEERLQGSCLWLPSGEEAEVVHDGSKRALYFPIRARNASDGSAHGAHYPPVPKGRQQQKSRSEEEQKSRQGRRTRENKQGDGKSTQASASGPGVGALACYARWSFNIPRRGAGILACQGLGRKPTQPGREPTVGVYVLRPNLRRTASQLTRVRERCAHPSSKANKGRIRFVKSAQIRSNPTTSTLVAPLAPKPTPAGIW